MSASVKISMLSYDIPTPAKPVAGEITTSEEDKEILASNNLNAKQIAEKLHEIVILQHASAKLTISFGSGEHTFCIDGLLGKMKRIEPQKHTCEVDSCKTDIMMRYVFNFFTTTEGFLEKHNNSCVTLSMKNIHHIVRHHNFGEGEDRIDPIRLARCLKL